MNITVINGTEKHGVTYRLKEMFLAGFSDNANITEYYLPKDCPAFCAGCTNCILKGEQKCKDAEYIRKIEKSLLEADLIVMTSPAYVFHATGAMKALLDHFAYRWIPHRPAPEMFGKRAVIITQCLGSGAKSAAKDMKHSLSWWGISKIEIFTGALMSDIVWEKLPQKKQAELAGKLQKLSRKFAHIDYTFFRRYLCPEIAVQKVQLVDFIQFNAAKDSRQPPHILTFEIGTWAELIHPKQQ